MFSIGELVLYCIEQNWEPGPCSQHHNDNNHHGEDRVNIHAPPTLSSVTTGDPARLP